MINSTNEIKQTMRMEKKRETERSIGQSRIFKKKERFLFTMGITEVFKNRSH